MATGSFRVWRRPVSVLIGLAFLAAPSAGASASCALVPGERGRVTAVVDGQTLKLDTGIVVRLVGVQVSHPAVWEDDLSLQASAATSAPSAHAFLEQKVLGHSVQLFYGGRRRDRHGRALAHVFAHDAGAERRMHGDWTGTDAATPARVWVQGRLVASGLGLAASFVDNRSCLADLLDHEAAAQASGLGVWARQSGAPGPVIGALELRDLFGARHRFQIVEGTVLATGLVRGTTYLNFGDDWRRDFTVIIRPRGRRRFDRPGLPDPGALTGRRIRVRGWIDLRNGPFIEVDHPEQLEVMPRE